MNTVMCGANFKVVVNPFSGLSAGMGLATSVTAAVFSALNKADGAVRREAVDETEDDEEQSDLAIITQAAYKLAMRKIKRAKRKPITRKRP
jgi:hypothetical protein